MSSLLNKLSSNAVPINCVWSKYSGCVCCGCEKKLVWGTIDTQSPKMIHSNNSDWYFNFHFYSQQAVCVCVCVCVCVGGGGMAINICIPHSPQVGVTQSLTYQRSMGNLVPGGRSSVLNWVLKLNHLFKFFEVLNLVFACICNEND